MGYGMNVCSFVTFGGEVDRLKGGLHLVKGRKVESE
jgi:hypothetical protein